VRQPSARERVQRDRANRDADACELLEPGGLGLEVQRVKPIIPSQRIDDLAHRPERVTHYAVLPRLTTGAERAQRCRGGGWHGTGQDQSAVEQPSQVWSPRLRTVQQVVTEAVHHHQDVALCGRQAEHVAARQFGGKVSRQRRQHLAQRAASVFG